MSPYGRGADNLFISDNLSLESDCKYLTFRTSSLMIQAMAIYESPCANQGENPIFY